jgi:alkylated DNA repair dioxygenase AlkB
MFAVERFTMANKDARAHLMAMARNFADMDLPRQPIAVELVRIISVPAPPVTGTADDSTIAAWDSQRGAAAMALWAVPTMGPWLDVLRCWIDNSNAFTAATAVGAPWLGVPPWRGSNEQPAESPILWRAMLDEFSRPGLAKEWRPKAVLESIAHRARSLGDDSARVERLQHATTSLLQDNGTIMQFGLHDDVLALALQLLLLRPSPERFATWRNDFRAVPPGSWWTGAILAGYVCGFRALPLSQRGLPFARQLLAVRTWSLNDRDRGAWNNMTPSPVEWRFGQDAIVIQSGHEVLAELKASTRGRWHEADLREPVTRQAAKVLARELFPDCISKTLVLPSGEFTFSGDATIKKGGEKKSLHVKDRMAVVLGTAARIEEDLDEATFRFWLATAGIQDRLPQLPAVASKAEAPPPSSERPTGLRLVKDFITQEEEASLLAAIDASEWDSSMNRRVQHYGWRYNYKAKKVDPAGYIGPLPDWVLALAHRLHDSGLVPEIPDQVIVNEYVGSQGIAKHIDCPECFRGPIVTISLIETWEMVFTRKAKPATSKKFEILLYRRSAAILDGEARHNWQHEIPRKKGRPARGRRVSITFRKVDN